MKLTRINTRGGLYKDGGGLRDMTQGECQRNEEEERSKLSQMRGLERKHEGRKCLRK